MKNTPAWAAIEIYVALAKALGRELAPEALGAEARRHISEWPGGFTQNGPARAEAMIADPDGHGIAHIAGTLIPGVAARLRNIAEIVGGPLTQAHMRTLERLIEDESARVSAEISPEAWARLTPDQRTVPDRTPYC